MTVHLITKTATKWPRRGCVQRGDAGRRGHPRPLSLGYLCDAAQQTLKMCPAERAVWDMPEVQAGSEVGAGIRVVGMGVGIGKQQGV